MSDIISNMRRSASASILKKMKSIGDLNVFLLGSTVCETMTCYNGKAYENLARQPVQNEYDSPFNRYIIWDVTSEEFKNYISFSRYNDAYVHTNINSPKIDLWNIKLK